MRAPWPAVAGAETLLVVPEPVAKLSIEGEKAARRALMIDPTGFCADSDSRHLSRSYI